MNKEENDNPNLPYRALENISQSNIFNRTIR
jgi:hypothetical protein